MDKKLLELAVEIVQSQVSINKMSGEEIETTLLRVYNALHKMQLAEGEGRSISIGNGNPPEGHSAQMESAQRVDPRGSIQEDKVTCLECGMEFRQLTANHLRTHQLSPREYKRKWGFPLKQPLAARILTRMRSRSAKKRGLPQNLQQYLEDQRQKKTGMEAEERSAGKSESRRSAGQGSR